VSATVYALKVNADHEDAAALEFEMARLRERYACLIESFDVITPKDPPRVVKLTPRMPPNPHAPRPAA